MDLNANLSDQLWKYKRRVCECHHQGHKTRNVVQSLEDLEKVPIDNPQAIPVEAMETGKGIQKSEWAEIATKGLVMRGDL